MVKWTKELRAAYGKKYYAEHKARKLEYSKERYDQQKLGQWDQRHGNCKPDKLPDGWVISYDMDPDYWIYHWFKLKEKSET